MKIKSLLLKNFRCFPVYKLDCNFDLLIFEGPNGSGKSSLLEAFHYACYLRSFRTSVSRELIEESKDAFFLQLVVSKDELIEDLIEVSSSGNRRQIKINTKKAQSYKELLDYYKVITVTEDDLMVLKGSPENRRLFIDSALALQDDSFLLLLKSFKNVLEQRNALLQGVKIDFNSYLIWTEKLWFLSQDIALRREKMLKELVVRANKLGNDFFSEELKLVVEYYKKRSSYNSWEEFSKNLNSLQLLEIRLKRSLFGAHLDDFVFFFKNKNVQKYTSRGQQKLIILLLKIAQFSLGAPAVFLLDDFMTDLDPKISALLLKILVSLDTQVIITIPNTDFALYKQLEIYQPKYIKLDN